MTEFLEEMLSGSLFFGMMLTLTAYWVGMIIKKKFNYTLINPLLIASVIIAAILLASGISFETYNYGAKYVSYLLTPATVCLAVPMYKQFEILKKNLTAVMAGILSGAIAGAASILFMCFLFKLSPEIYNSLLPKSVTTAIAIGISGEIGGTEAVTVCAVIITGIFGAIIAKPVFKLFRINEPVSRGLALGNSAHAIGTSKAIEFGEIEGAMSSLSIVVAGIMTVLIAYVMSRLSGVLR